MMRWKVLILDFDGVLVESVGIKDQGFEFLFKDYPEALDAIMAYHLAHNAVIRFEKFKYIHEVILKIPYDKDTEKRCAQAYSNFVLQKIFECPGVKGAKEFLDYFKDKCPIYLASVNPQDDLAKVLDKRGIRDYFKRVYAHPWKKSRAIAEILAQEGLSQEQAVFVGDTPEDYQASLAAKVAFIGRQSAKELKHFGVPVFNDLFEIKDYLIKQD